MMTVTVKRKENCELVISSLDYLKKHLALPIKPTVCLISVNAEYAREEISLIIRKALDLGCVAFLTWGNYSVELEDLIDEIIELSLDKDLSHVITISQNDEDANDVAWFFINSVYLEEGDYRCLALFDVLATNWNVLQKELIFLME